MNGKMKDCVMTESDTVWMGRWRTVWWQVGQSEAVWMETLRCKAAVLFVTLYIVSDNADIVIVAKFAFINIVSKNLTKSVIILIMEISQWTWLVNFVFSNMIHNKQLALNMDVSDLDCVLMESMFETGA